jgi:hypothetical protein
MNGAPARPALLGFNMYPVGYIFNPDPAKSSPWAISQLAEMYPMGYNYFLQTIF